jgi:acyl dehydratase
MSAATNTTPVLAAFTTQVPPVTTMQLVKYAGASDDYNRIHYDQQFALDAGLGGVIAHGMLTMGFMASAAASRIGPRGRVQKISARFTAPVRPGDSVTVTCAVKTRELADGRALLTCDLSATVGDRIVAAGDAVLSLPIADADALISSCAANARALSKKPGEQ